MTKIQVLPPLIAERIAAGEVIERPSSVIKELVENAIDAGATSVQVRVTHGGMDSIEVQDNGSGMSPDDLSRSVLRHATSKIHTVEDLSHLTTLGFRGEALPSIASVATLKIASREKGSNETFEIVADQTAPVTQTPRLTQNFSFSGSSHGTRVTVQSLFSQIPARLKFLKSKSAETSSIREVLERIALSHPEIEVTFLSDDRKIFHYPAETDLDRAKRILTDDAPFESLEVHLKGAYQLHLTWFKGLSVPHARKMIQSVNGRPVKDRILQNALMNPLRQSFLPGHYPVLMARFQIPSDEIDFNVHPTKNELRFFDPSKIYALCQAAFDDLFRQTFRSSPQVSHQNSPQSLSPNPFSFTNTHASYSSFGPENFSMAPLSASVEPLWQEKVYGQYRGTLFSTYLMFESGPELLLIDQHAADERIRYERLKKAWFHPSKESGLVNSQLLLVPEPVKLSDAFDPLIEMRLDLLRKMGFDVETFGENTILFRGIPAAFGSGDLPARLKNLIERVSMLAEKDLSLSHVFQDESLFERIAMEACRSSVKAGDRVQMESANELAKKLFDCEHPGNCPHGRPTFIRISENKLEEWFNRKVL